MLKKQHDMITDFVTGKQIPIIGSEENRQAFCRYLVEEKGYTKNDISIDVPIEIDIHGEKYKSVIDLVISIDSQKTKCMAVKCAAGSLGSREREIVSASRLLDRYQIPFSVVSDGKNALVLDTLSGQKIGEGLDTVPSKKDIIEIISSMVFAPLPENRREKEKLIFRSYDSMNINRTLPFNHQE